VAVAEALLRELDAEDVLAGLSSVAETSCCSGGMPMKL
jgi:hypothetical protein